MVITNSPGKQVREIIVEIFQLDVDNLPETISADTVKQWDSLGHVRLIVQLEKQLSLRFSQEQVSTLWSEDNIVKAISELMCQG